MIKFLKLDKCHQVFRSFRWAPPETTNLSPQGRTSTLYNQTRKRLRVPGFSPPHSRYSLANRVLPQRNLASNQRQRFNLASNQRHQFNLASNQPQVFKLASSLQRRCNLASQLQQPSSASNHLNNQVNRILHNSLSPPERLLNSANYRPRCNNNLKPLSQPKHRPSPHQLSWLSNPHHRNSSQQQTRWPPLPNPKQWTYSRTSS